jgi:microcystin-dependent protein
MSNPFLGEIRPVGFNFAPQGWATCSGQLLSIAANNALFALLGTTYGGDGITSFGLPDLRSRHATGDGAGTNGAGNYVQGQRAGAESVTLGASQIPVHTHQARGNTGGATTTDPTNATWGTSTTALYASAMPTQQDKDAVVGFMASDALASSGGSQPHDNQPPALVITYIICLGGIFPSAN